MEKRKSGSILFAASLACVVILPLFLAGGLGMAARVEERSVVVLGLDSSGNEVQRVLPAGAYTKAIATALSTVRRSMLPALALHGERPAVAPAWRLRSLGVGLGLSGSLGLGSVLSVAAMAKLRLIFTNSSSPVYPD